jgi:hypothetical protein
LFALLRLPGLSLRRIQDGPEFIEVAKTLVSLNSNFFDHSDKYSRIILLTVMDSDKVVFQNCPLFQIYFLNNKDLALNPCPFSNFHFADLNCGLNVGVVGHIRHDCLGVQTEGRLKCLH